MNTNQPETIVYWSELQLKYGTIYLAASKNGLLYVGSLQGDFEEIHNWVNKHIKNANLEKNDDILEPYKTEIIDFMDGKRTKLTSRCEEIGTSFQKEVWQALRKIPYGETRTYSDIAAMIQKPQAIRAVGRAIGANPLLIYNPCHRVIGKNGKLTGFRGGLIMKKRLLKVENVNFEENEQQRR